MRTPEEYAYHGAKQRCTNPKRSQYKRYGGRGIEFRYTSYKQFLADVGCRPSPEHELDRENNNGHYEPGNVRWVTGSLSSANRTSSTPNTNGFKGAHFENGCWVARIRLAGHQFYLGCFSGPEIAAHAYKIAAQSRALGD